MRDGYLIGISRTHIKMPQCDSKQLSSQCWGHRDRRITGYSLASLTLWVPGQWETLSQNKTTRAVVVHAFNLSPQEAVRSLSSGPECLTSRAASVQPGLLRNPVLKNQNHPKQTNKKPHNNKNTNSTWETKILQIYVPMYIQEHTSMKESSIIFI